MKAYNNFKIICTLVAIIIVMSIHLNPAWAINVASGLYMEKTSEIGGTYTDVIKVINTNDHPVEIKLYQTDFSFSSDGTNDYGEPGKSIRSNARWIDRLPQQVSILPKQTALIQYAVNVPKDPSISGSYWSIIMVEQINEDDLKALSMGQRQLGIRQLTRYGVQVVTHIGSSGTRQLEFRGMKLQKYEDKQVLSVDVENSGTRALNTNFWIDFYSENGGYSKKILGQQRHIYPQCSVMQKLDISEIPPGMYKAVVVADAGDETVFGTSFSIKLKE